MLRMYILSAYVTILWNFREENVTYDLMYMKT